jgi:choline transport protein
MIAACIAEMASAIPSSSGVYHWASVTAGAKYGKVVGFFAGWYVCLKLLLKQLLALTIIIWGAER